MSRRNANEIRVETLLGMIGQLQIGRADRLLKPLELNRSKFAVLRYVVDHESVTISEMAERLELNQPGITKIVQQFIDDGWIVSKQVAGDKRQRLLEPTSKGKERCMATFETLLPSISLPYANLKAKELEQLGDYLEQIKDWLDTNRDK